MRKTVRSLPLTYSVPNRVREGYWPILLVRNSDHLYGDRFLPGAISTLSACIRSYGPLEWIGRSGREMVEKAVYLVTQGTLLENLSLTA